MLTGETKFDINLQMTTKDIKISGDMAVEWGLATGTMTPRNGDKALKFLPLHLTKDKSTRQRFIIEAKQRFETYAPYCYDVRNLPFLWYGMFHILN